VVDQRGQPARRESAAVEVGQVDPVVVLQVCLDGVAVLIEQADEAR